MREELEEKLVKEFPFLAKNSEQREEDRIDNLYLAFGCECDDGWYELLREMFGEIVARYEEAGVPVDLEILQIKEKFAELRVYYSFKEESSPDKEELRNDVDKIIEAYENKSRKVCENCGAEGEVRKKGYRMRTLCDQCNDKIMK